MDGLTSRFSEGELIGYLLDKHRPGEQIKVMVLRGAERTELALPMQQATAAQTNPIAATKALPCKLAKAAWHMMIEQSLYDAGRIFLGVL